MVGQLILHIDVSDWDDEANDEELVITNPDDIIALLESGFNTAQIARATIVNRERGLAEQDIVRPNKVLLQTGAQMEISQIVRRVKEEVTGRNGRVYQAPAYVGRVPERPYIGDEMEEDEDVEASYVPLVNRSSIDRAEHYLESVVPGHIWNRLLVIYSNGGDVQAAAQRLIRLINQQVWQLVHSEVAVE